MQNDPSAPVWRLGREIYDKDGTADWRFILSRMGINTEKLKIRLDSYLTSYSKINSRRIIVLAQKAKLQCFHYSY